VRGSLRVRLIVALALALALTGATIAGIRLVSAGDLAGPGGAAGQDSHRALGTRPASYFGVYEQGVLGSYQPISEFARAAGRSPNLAGYFSGWAEPFKTAFATTARQHGAATIVQIDPTGASVAAIAAGDYDDYLRADADDVRSFGYPVVIGFGHEMNANWYSWGYGHVPPRTFIKAWQHLVALFRLQGASNVTWLWTVQADIPGSGPIAAWWPGARYVNWVGIDGYYFQPSSTFANVFGATISQLRLFTGKPVLLSETSVGPAAGQLVKIPDLFRGMAAYQTLGLVWFDIAQHDGIYHQDWRIEDDPRAEAIFRQNIARYVRG
jgi:mannan endo-1,4-beta-mannosidase